LLIALITLIANGHANAFFQALFGGVGAFGLATAITQAILKTKAQDLLTRLQQDADADLVVAAVAEVPDKPRVRRRAAGPARTRGMNLATVPERLIAWPK